MIRSLDDILAIKFEVHELIDILKSQEQEKEKFFLAIQFTFKEDSSPQQQKNGIALLKRINKLSLSEFADVALFFEDILHSDQRVISRPGGNIQYLSLIQFISHKTTEKETFTMAIQKHLIQRVDKQSPSSVASFDSILQLIDTLKHEGIPFDPKLRLIFITIFLEKLSDTNIGRDSTFISGAKKISDFFEDLQQCESIRNVVLQKVYDTIAVSEDKDVSPFISLALNIFPSNEINRAVLYMLSSASCQHDGNQETHIVHAITRLCKWQRFLNYSNLDIWVTQVLENLKNEKHSDIITEIIEKNLDELILATLIPVSRNGSFNIFKCVLSMQIYNKRIVDKVVNRSMKALKYFKESNCDIYGELLQLVVLYMNYCPSDILSEDYNEFLGNLRELSGECDFFNSNACFKYPRLSNAEHNGNRRVGLENLGNTCYLNSVLQALYMTNRFSSELLKEHSESRDIQALQNVFALLSFSDRNYINIKSAMQNIRPMDFIPGLQQDSYEFMGSLLDRLHEADKKKDQTNGKCDEKMDAQECEAESGNATKYVDNTCVEDDSTIIHKTFGGKISTTCICSTCNMKSIIIDSFRDLALSFPEKEKNEHNWDEQESYDVQKLLNYYFEMEHLTLDGDNQYRCDNCKILRDGSRCTEILEAPNNLILTLKHFRYDPKFHTRSKLLIKHMYHNETIKVNVKTSSQSWREVEYKLFAAVVHSGMSLDSGHYYTFANDKDLWFKFNDSYVTRSTLEELHSLDSLNTPYILFYERISTASSSPPNPSSIADMIEEKLSFTDLPSYLKTNVLEDNDKFRRESNKQMIQPIKASFNSKPWNNDDDPPPPSCGNNFNGIQTQRFIY